MHQRFPLLAAGVLGATGVVFGAVGAHTLAGYLGAHGGLEVWETGVRYQLIHAVAILGLAGWMKPPPTGLAAHRAIMAVRCWFAGTILFSGSLYLLASGLPHWLGAVTPIGGLILVAGWVYAAGAAVAPRSEYDI